MPKEIKEQQNQEEVVETEKAPETKEEPKVEEKQEQPVENKVEEKQEEQPEQQPQENGVENQEQPTEEQAKVEEVEETPANAIRVEDLVTKQDLQEMLGAFTAKLDAIIKENQDLKDANSKLQEKYETGDFGTENKVGGMGNQNMVKKDSYQSFEEYAKQFM